MNYIELINWFWGLDEAWQFSCCETRLYFYLLKTANRLGWENNWTRSDAKVSSDVGVSPNSMKTARNRLVQAGLISTRQGGNGFRCKTRYQILIPKHTPNHIPNLLPNYEPNLTSINKLKHKHKQIPLLSPKGDISPGKTVSDDLENEIPDNPPKPPEREKEKSCAEKEKKAISSLSFPYTSEKFMIAWQNLLLCPKWKKKIPYTLQLTLNKLAKFEEEYVIILLEMAAANDWQGLIFPDTEEKYLKWKRVKNNKPNIVNHDNSQIYTKF